MCESQQRDVVVLVITIRVIALVSDDFLYWDVLGSA